MHCGSFSLLLWSLRPLRNISVLIHKRGRFHKQIRAILDLNDDEPQWLRL